MRGTQTKRQIAIKELCKIPGVGKSIAVDLLDIGIESIADLKSKNPQAMYEKLCKIRGQKIDRCVLYVFRCAVYYATEEKHDPAKLKWWLWKYDQQLPGLDYLKKILRENHESSSYHR
jgi:hypothetical protein